MFHERQVTANERQRVERGLAGRGVMLYRGTASFVDPHTRARGPGGEPGPGSEPGGAEVLLRGETILIATGSSPVRPPAFPFEHDRVHDSDEVLQLERLPRSMAVVGAGVIGCEYACTFAALGTKVWIIDGRDELLPFLDQEVSAALEEAMRQQLGIEFLWKVQGHRLRRPRRGGHPPDARLGRHARRRRRARRRGAVEQHRGPRTWRPPG